MGRESDVNTLDLLNLLVPIQTTPYFVKYDERDKLLSLATLVPGDPAGGYWLAFHV